LEFADGVREELIKRGAKLRPSDKMKDGGLEHRYWNSKIAEINRAKGYTVELEKHIKGNGYVDQVIQKNGDIIAVEIETGKSSFVNTLIRDLQSFKVVICVATNDESYQKIRAKLIESNLHEDKRIILVKANLYQ
jgi:hypothetical protein